MLRMFLKSFTSIHVFLYRLTGGKIGGKIQGLQVLLLTTIRRKSGQVRTTPLGTFEHDGGFVIVGSYAGFGALPAWFHNLRSNPRAAIQVNDKQFEVEAEVVGPDKRGQLWARLISIATGYSSYAKRTSREIPLVLLRPVKV